MAPRASSLDGDGIFTPGVIGFGSHGKVRTTPWPPQRLFAQPNGDIVLMTVGQDAAGCGETCVYSYLVFVRFSSNGRFLSKRINYYSEWELQAADIEPSGEIVVSGFDLNGEENFLETLARLSPSGRIEPSLGGKRGLKIRIPSPFGGTVALAILPDGSFVLSCDEPPILQRRTRNGALDTSFGENGIVRCHDENGLGSSEPFHNLKALPGGAFLAMGSRGPCGLVKYLPNGIPDPSFGPAGSVNLEAQGLLRPMAALDGGQGRIVVAGWDSASRTVRVARLYPAEASIRASDRAESSRWAYLD